MSRADLTSVRAKLGWAARHFKLLDAAIGDWAQAPDHPTVAAEADLANQRYALIYYEPRPKPLDWSLIAGDCLQNLRSTLDHLVAAVVTAHGRVAAINHAFPIATSETWWRENVVNRDVNKRRPGPLDGIDPSSAEWRLIADAQPYKRGKPADAKRSPLAQLARLNNADKHRELNISTLGIGSQFNLSMSAAWRLIDGYIPPSGAVLEPNAAFGWLKLELVDVDEAQLKVEFPFEVAFDEVTLSGLRDMFEEVKRLVVAFEPILA